MKKIPLTQKMFALVDDADYDFLMQWKWFANKNRNTYYACRWDRPERGVRLIVKMHRQLLGLTDSKIKCDHCDNDGLNNQRGNLRTCNTTQNNQNRRTRRDNTTGSKGVSVHKGTGKYQSEITHAGKRVYLGLFSNIKDAAQAYDDAAIRLHGEFAKPNSAI